jgi:hypothetical protein
MNKMNWILIIIACAVAYILGKVVGEYGRCPYHDASCEWMDDPYTCPHFDATVCPYQEAVEEGIEND